MWTHILLATDGSQLAEKAVSSGLKLARRLHASATAVTVSEPWAVARTAHGAALMVPYDAFEKAVGDKARTTLARVDELAKELGIECTTVHIKETKAADGIIQTAKSRNCDLIVMASHGRRGWERLVLGSQALNVLTCSPVPLLICK